jgi:hypothetical protein
MFSMITMASDLPMREKAACKQNRYLLLDSRIIEHVENVVLTVGMVKKDPKRPLVKEDKPWEPRCDDQLKGKRYSLQFRFKTSKIHAYGFGEK